MNFALLSEEVEVVDKEQLIEKESELVKLIEALRAVESTEAWSTLKTHIFDKTLESLQRSRIAEASKTTIDSDKIHRINGQIVMSKRYSSLGKLADSLALELKNVRKLNPPTERATAQ